MIRISVIIPTYNRVQQIKACLKALVKQSLNRESWQIIIVNDGGESLNNLIAEFDMLLSIDYVEQENKGPAKARNVGAERAKGDILAFTDDDCLPEPNWLESILKCAKRNVLLGGRVLNLYSNNDYAEASQLLINFLYAYNQGTPDAFFTSNNLALFREDFVKLSGFSTHFSTSAGEDRELCVRAAASGMTLSFCSEMQIQHAHFLNWSSFLRMHKKYGYAAFQYQKEVDQQGVSVTKSPRLPFYVQLLFYPFNKDYSLLRSVRLSFLLILSQLSVAQGYFKNRWL